jgi:hypothetical protein
MCKFKNITVIHIFQKDLVMPFLVTYGDVKMTTLLYFIQGKAYV